jgi:ribosomal protein S18 acetylase RimI-like enzyme
MKDLKHIQTFEQHQGNLNISDVSGSKLYLKYIKPFVVDENGWLEEGMADFGIYQDKNLIATLFLDDEEPELFIRGLDVKEKFRNKGYGKKILDLIKDYAIKEGFKYITLNYYKSNKIAERLYKSYGFLESDDQFEESPVVNLILKL